MPLNELETHPYLDGGADIVGNKLILGSFPVYECTDPDSAKKSESRLQEGTFRFFYGSCDNQFWKLYKRYIDSTLVEPFCAENLIASLTVNEICISDTVVSSYRIDYSSEDNKLRKRTWNKLSLQKLIINNGVKKILCTSKGVLSDLESKIVHPSKGAIGRTMFNLTQEFETNLLKDLGGTKFGKSTCINRVFKLSNGQIIEAIAIPSPGSWQRHLRTFGYSRDSKIKYKDDYYRWAFNWFGNQ